MKGKRERFAFNFKNDCGLSLLEVIMSLGLLSLFLFGILNFYSLGVRAYQQGSSQAEAQQHARIALFHMDRSLRTVDRYNIMGGTTGSVIEFYYEGSQRKYTYRVRHGELEYLVDTSVTKVASHITSLNFISTPQGVIKIDITASVHGREYRLSSGVKPRNIP